MSGVSALPRARINVTCHLSSRVAMHTQMRGCLGSEISALGDRV